MVLKPAAGLHDGQSPLPSPPSHHPDSPLNTLSLGPVIYGMSVQPPSVQLKLSAGFVQPPFIISLTGAVGGGGGVRSLFPPDLLSGGQASLALREMPLDFIFQMYYPRAARQFNL